MTHSDPPEEGQPPAQGPEGGAGQPPPASQPIGGAAPPTPEPIGGPAPPPPEPLSLPDLPPPPSPDAPPPPGDTILAGGVRRMSDEERRAILAQQIQMGVVQGRRIESQSEFQAVLVSGQKVNHTLHAILTIFTCLIWGIVWIILSATGGEKRELLVIDDFGNVQLQALGRA